VSSFQSSGISSSSSRSSSSRPEELARRRAEFERKLREQQQDQRFVFVQPLIDMKVLQPPQRAPLSDADRRAQTREAPPTPTNIAPFARGNTPEEVEAQNNQRAAGDQNQNQPTLQPQPESQEARVLPPSDQGFQRPQQQPQIRPRGALGDALRNLQQYVQKQTFDNPQGGLNQPGASIQFDTKGVEFGPWLRRFVAQVRHNWFIPQAAMTFHGHCVLTFNIHKDGTITDVTVLQPSDIDGFNKAAIGAITGSNPTEPLPPEYPSDKAFFTVTFYYNEDPDR
jgi:TonB family protein